MELKKSRALLKKASLTALITQYHGNIALIARVTGLTRPGIYKAIQRENLHELLEQERESIVDMAEDALRKAVEDGAPWAISLVLRTLGRKRGYVERQEQVVAPATINHAFNYDDAVTAITQRPS